MRYKYIILAIILSVIFWYIKTANVRKINGERPLVSQARSNIRSAAIIGRATLAYSERPENITSFEELINASDSRDYASCIDPFDNRLLKTVCIDRVPYIYSVGPDRIDQKGTLPYDPTNGIISSGDIMRRVRDFVIVDKKQESFLCNLADRH